MKYVSTMIVVLIAAAGVWAMLREGWNIDLSSARARNAENATRPLLSSSQLPVDELTRITLSRAGEPPLIFERTGAEWNQMKPFAHPMDPFSIRQIAQQAREVQVIDVIDPLQPGEAVSAQSLSLKPAAAEIMYEWPGGSLTLHLGRRGVAGRAYLQIKGEESIYVVASNLHERAIEMDHKEWRSRAIFPGAVADSVAIKWSNGPAQMTLGREGAQWKMIEPLQTRLDSAFRDQYIDAIGRAVVSGFILDQPTDDDLVKFGLKDSAVSLTITPGGTGETPVPPKAPQRLIIGARAGGGTQDFFGMVEGRPAVVRISGAVLAALFRQPQDLVAHTASGVIPADVKSIVIRAKDAPDELRLERDLEKWRVTSATPAAEVNAAQVQELLDQLTKLRALAVQFVTQYPGELEVATITLHGFDGRAIDTIRIIKDTETGRWAMENGDNVIRIYPAGLNLRLRKPDFELK